MPGTEEEKQREIARVTKISGFRVAAHELLAEIDLRHGSHRLKARNDRWEAEHGKMTRQERMEEELQRAMVYAGAGKAPEHIAIHIHMAHECGASEEYLLERLLKAAQWGGAAESGQTALEAWRRVFMPEFPSVFPTRIMELTSDSVPAR
jgi:hypothetical protein